MTPPTARGAPVTEHRVELARCLSERIAREREMLPILSDLGVDAAQIRVLRGDQQLMEILAEDCLHADDAAWGDLQTVLVWHQARLERLTSQLSCEERFYA